MGAWGIVGIVLGALALLCVALCLIPGRLLLLYDAQEGFRLRGSVLCFTFGGGKPKPKKPPKKEEEKKEAPKSAEQHGSVSLKTLTEHAEELAALLGKLLRQLGKLTRSIVVKELRLLCVVGGDDPAAAALRYGSICAVLYPALGLLHDKLRVSDKNEQIDLTCDFDGEDLLEFRMLLQLRAVHVLRTLLPLTPPVLRLLRELRQGGAAASRKRPPKA